MYLDVKILGKKGGLGGCLPLVLLFSFFDRSAPLCFAAEGPMKRAKIARNTHTAPHGSKIILMSQVMKQTLAKTSDKLIGSNVKIHRCSGAFIYLLSPLR